MLRSGCDERAVEAGHLLKEHLAPVIEAPGHRGPAANQRIPGREGRSGRPRDASAPLRSRSMILREQRRPRAAHSWLPAVRAMARCPRCDIVLDVSGGVPLFPAAELRDGYLRAESRDPAALLGAAASPRSRRSFDKPGMSLSANISARTRAPDRRLHALPRSMPGRRHHTGGQPRRRGRQPMRRLRPVYRCVSDRRCGLCAPTVRDLAAEIPGATDNVSRDGGRARDGSAARRPARGAADRCAGPMRRGAAGARAAVRGQRGDASRSRGHRRPFAYGASAMRLLLRAKPRHDVSGLRRIIAVARASPHRARLRRRPHRHHRNRRSGPAGRDAARNSCDGARAAPASFLPVGDKRGVLRFALRELHRARRERRCDRPSRAFPVWSGGNRYDRLHALPFLRHRGADGRGR